MSNLHPFGPGHMIVEPKPTRFMNGQAASKLYVIRERIIVVDGTASCGSCGKKTQDYPIYCYMCDDYFCSENCHLQKHAKPWQKY